MRQYVWFALVLVLGQVAAPAHAQTADTVTSILHPGDALRVVVWRQPELSGEFPVAEDGSISHPLYRDIQVVGLPLAEVERQVRTFLARLETTPRFVVQPLLRVSVGGEVRQPSLYRLPPETSIAEAVALAGGATDRGRLERVRLFRGGEEIVVDLTHPEAGLAQQSIRSGDQVFVDRRISIFREYIAPAGSITAALAALLNILLR